MVIRSGEQNSHVLYQWQRRALRRIWLQTWCAAQGSRARQVSHPQQSGRNRARIL